jgi:GTP-dependent phosphoenolpyruvate carboxykinase
MIIRITHYTEADRVLMSTDGSYPANETSNYTCQAYELDAVFAQLNKWLPEGVEIVYDDENEYPDTEE